MEPEDIDHLRNVLIDAGHVLLTAHYFASVKLGHADATTVRIDQLRVGVGALLHTIEPDETDANWGTLTESLTRGDSHCGDD